MDFRTDPSQWCALQGEPRPAQICVYEAALLTKDRSARGDSLPYGEAVWVYAKEGSHYLITRQGAQAYVGWVLQDDLEFLANPIDASEGGFFHGRVYSRSAPLFSKPDIKSHIHLLLPVFAALRLREIDENFMELANGGGYVHRSHVQDPKLQPSEYAQYFLGAPYLWGGKTALGLDCSGLTQLSYQLAGLDIPRDADMQEAALPKIQKGDLRANDLVFWKGHVGMMLDPTRLIHATAFAMSTIIEPLDQTIARVGEPTGYRRPSVT